MLSVKQLVLIVYLRKLTNSDGIPTSSAVLNASLKLFSYGETIEVWHDVQSYLRGLLGCMTYSVGRVECVEWDLVWEEMMDECTES